MNDDDIINTVLYCIFDVPVLSVLPHSVQCSIRLTINSQLDQPRISARGYDRLRRKVP